MKIRSRVLVLTALGALVVGAVVSGQGAGAASTTAAQIPMASPLKDTAKENIARIAAGTEATQTVTRLVIQAGLVGTLQSSGPFTVFAPVNEAFAAVPADALQSVADDLPTLTQVLTLHVVPGTYSSADLKKLDGQSLTTAQGGKLLVQVQGKDIVVGGAKVAVPDITASNGVVHAVDTVILQPNG
ncbi:MAG: fasciclin domain-containing protein [Actinomycetes bacterium]